LESGVQSVDGRQDKAPFDRQPNARVPSLRYTEITHVIAERNYVRVFCKDGTSVRIRGGITEWQLLLAEHGAVRLNRSLILNLLAVQQVQRIARDLTLVTLTNATRPLRLGRRAAAQLDRIMRGKTGKPAAAAEGAVLEHVPPISAGNIS
jgi:DNA-binding LytR/AlgR family response regulator